MTLVYIATLVLLGAAALMTVARLLRGPTEFDRIVAMEVLAVLLICAIAVRTASGGGAPYTTLTLVIALLGFVGSVTAARLAAQWRERR
jgi:multicomponent Na+:H+ antiporter subunit F